MTISSAGLKEVDLGRLSRITSSLSTVERNAVNSSAARASDNASRARDVIRLQCIYNFLLFHAIILSVLDVLYAFICYFILFLGLTY